jgi:hypothetical protein
VILATMRWTVDFDSRAMAASSRIVRLVRCAAHPRGCGGAASRTMGDRGASDSRQPLDQNREPARRNIGEDAKAFDRHCQIDDVGSIGGLVWKADTRCEPTGAVVA